MAVKNKYLKDNVMINWINGYKAGNKKAKWYLELRLGTITVLDLKWEAKRFRLMILNLGFQV
jgi:hypothetical protein